MWLDALESIIQTFSPLNFLSNFIPYFVAIKAVELVRDIIWTIRDIEFLDGTSCYIDGHLFPDALITMRIVFGTTWIYIAITLEMNAFKIV